MFFMVSSAVTEPGTSINKEFNFFYSFYFIFQGKLIILRNRYFLHQIQVSFNGLKKTLLQHKFCWKLKSSISKVVRAVRSILLETRISCLCCKTFMYLY